MTKENRVSLAFWIRHMSWALLVVFLLSARADEVAEDGATRVTLLDGEVTLMNRWGSTELKPGEQGLVQTSEGPVRLTNSVDVMGAIQWSLAYPTVLELSDLPAAHLFLAQSFDYLRKIKASNDQAPPNWRGGIDLDEK